MLKTKPHTRTATNSFCAVLAIIVCTTVIWTHAPTTSSAQAKPHPASGPLAFGLLQLEDDKLTFYQGHSRTEFTSPAGALAGGRIDGKLHPNGYRTDEFAQHHDLTAAMGILASSGWNAVDYQQVAENKVTVLMRKVQ